MMTQRQVTQRKTVEVLLSDKRVVASEAQSVIPKGYRQATLEEVTLRYRHDANSDRNYTIKELLGHPKKD